MKGSGKLKFRKKAKASLEDTPAFGSVAERVRRGGDPGRAVELCRTGLEKFPGQLSARVTLGWALLDLELYDEARRELEQVLKHAPDNLAAIRGLAQLHERAEADEVLSLEQGEDWLAAVAEAEGSEPEASEDLPADEAAGHGTEAAAAGAAESEPDAEELDPDVPPADRPDAEPEVEIGLDDTPDLEAALDDLERAADGSERLDDALEVEAAGLPDVVAAARAAGDDGTDGESPIVALERFLKGKARRDKASVA